MSLRVHALAYAARGWPVFPVSADKRPLIKGWPERASTDAIRIWSWWEAHPGANIGCATGHAFDVVDLDGPRARAQMEQLAAEVGHAFTGPISKTGRREGGWQLFYAPTGLGNKRPNAVGVDFRGRGGFVILPPSVHKTGNVYTWLREPSACGELPELPAALRARLWPPRRPPQPIRHPTVPADPDRLHRWALAALGGIIHELCAVPAGMGQRNEALNRCGFRAYQLAHVLGEEMVLEALMVAANAIGYTADKGMARTLSTLRSARKGMESPRYPTGGPQ